MTFILVNFDYITQPSLVSHWMSDSHVISGYSEALSGALFCSLKIYGVSVLSSGVLAH